MIFWAPGRLLPPVRSHWARTVFKSTLQPLWPERNSYEKINVKTYMVKSRLWLTLIKLIWTCLGEPELARTQVNAGSRTDREWRARPNRRRGEKQVQAHELARLQAYLRQVFDNNRITVTRRERTDDSVEVAVGDEFIGVIYRDEDEGELSYAFQMAILEMDLPEV